MNSVSPAPIYFSLALLHARAKGTPCRRSPLLAILTTSIALYAAQAQAVNGTWQASPTSSNWVASGGENNWSSGANTFPGSTSILTNNDTATFLTSGTTAITINSPTLNVRSITFGVSGSTPSSFTVGNVAGNSLFLANAGTISIPSGVTAGGGSTDTINAPLVLVPGTATTAGIYSFSNAAGSTTNTVVIGGAISGGTTTLGVTLTLTGANAGANTVSGALTNGGATLGISVAKTSTGTWALSGINTYTGATGISGGSTNNGGTLTLNGANGSLTATSAVNINGGIFRFDNTTASGGPNNNRLNDSTAINVNGNSSGVTFAHSGVAATNYAETVGALNLNAGDFTYTSSAAASGQTSTFITSSFSRSGIATANFNGSNLGNAADAQNRLILTGSANSTFLGGWATFSGLGSFAAYDTTRGVFSAPSTGLGTAAASVSTANYRAPASATTLTTANGIYNGNTLAFASGTATPASLDLNGSTFKLSGGGITTASDLNSYTISNGTITAADSASPTTLYIHSRSTNVSPFTFGATIADPTGGGSLSIVKAGNISLILTVPNTFTGTTSINAGSLTLSHALALQNSVLDYNNQGGALALTNAATNYSIGGLSGAQSLAVAGSSVTGLTLGNSNGGTGTNATYNATLTLGNAIGLTKTGTNTQTFTGTLTTNSNSVTLAGGILALGSSTALGTAGNVIFTGGTLQHSATNNTDYSARIASGTSSGAVSIDTNGQTVTFATALTASQSGGLTKRGAGTLNLTTANSFTGPTNVTDSGTLQISGSINSTSAVSVTGGTLLLGAGSEKVADVATTLDGGTLRYSSGSAGGFTETLGTLTLSGTASLDFASTTTSGNTLFFSSLASGTATALNSGTTIALNVFNWTGSGSIQDHLVFDVSTGLSSGLAQINFYSGADTSSPLGTAREIAFGANDFEIVPIPEPSSTALFGTAALLGLIGYRESRLRRVKGRVRG